ncbi:transcriptional regulator, TetR family [Alteromonadaceae bacterium Bs31]|nr:transcriptional regulator, TetR family [Alteromonadaceae bacterium Bs31]
MSRAEKQTGNYHHGNLKQALVDAYIELLQTTPPEKLSLRKLAAQVGVAPTAVYNHFPDKIALVVEVKIRCLRHFARYLEGNSPSDDEPEKRIRNIGRAYFQYSIDHTQYYERIFQEDVPEEYVSEELLDAAMSAEAELRAIIVALLEKHGLPTSRYNEGLGAFACWSLAHGITALAAKHVNHAACLSGRWPEEFLLHDAETTKASFNAMTEVLVAGILAAARKTEDD